MSKRYITVGWSNFALGRHKPGSGFSYTELVFGGKQTDDKVCSVCMDNWKNAVPGDGETDLSRKILVPVPPKGFFCAPRAKIVSGMPVQAEITARQEGEDPFVDTFVYEDDAIKHDALITKQAKSVSIVCYSAEALTENDGERSTDCDWEIVCVLCEDGEKSPMPPLTMARNMLEKPGGTLSEYTAQEFADAVWHYGTQKTIRVKARPKDTDNG
jgi:hypothetical protein